MAHRPPTPWIRQCRCLVRFRVRSGILCGPPSKTQHRALQSTSLSVRLSSLSVSRLPELCLYNTARVGFEQVAGMHRGSNTGPDAVKIYYDNKFSDEQNDLTVSSISVTCRLRTYE